MKKTFLILLILLLLLSLTACSTAKPENAVSSFLDAMKNGNTEKLYDYINTAQDDSSQMFNEEDMDEIFSNEDEAIDKVFKSAYNKLEYEILGSEINGDNAIVETKISAPDFASIFSEIIEESFTLALSSSFSTDTEEYNEEEMDELMNNMIVEKFSSDDLPMVENTVKINLIKSDNGWLIDPDEDFYNALTGNLLTLGDTFESE
ncbi:MAG: hypothetical protein ACOWWH_10375 [Eubacteriaceae bacterium]